MEAIVDISDCPQAESVMLVVHKVLDDKNERWSLDNTGQGSLI